MARSVYDDFADYGQTRAQTRATDWMLERERRRRVKEENNAAFNEARARERDNSSTVTASAFYGDGMRRDYMGGTMVAETPLDMQRGIAAEFMDLANRSAAAKRHNAQIESDSLNAAMMTARRNGGKLPQNALDMLSRKLGMDGKTSAVFGAGYLGNGDFDIDIVTRQPNGGLQRTTKKISPLEQYNMMLPAAGVWGADGQAVANQLYERLRGTRGKSELADPSTYGRNLAAYQDGQRTKQEMQAGIELLKLAKEFSGNGKGGEEGLLKAVVGNRAFAGILARGDRIYEDAAGNEVDNPYEEDGKTLRNDVWPKRDDHGNIMYREDPELAFQRIHKAWERVSAGGGTGGSGGGIGDAIMQVALSHLSPRQPSPEEAEIAQRQRQNALDDQRRADVMRGREEQLIHYIDENGTHKVGSGYVVDGKVYDNMGNAMNVRLADGNGRPLSDEIDDRLKQRAEARKAAGVSGIVGTTPAGLDGADAPAQTTNYGLRPDGTPKGRGWLGEQRLSNGGVVTEFSIRDAEEDGDDAVVDKNGKYIDYPTLIPGLTQSEIDTVKNVAGGDTSAMLKPEWGQVVRKARAHAKAQIAKGESVFADDGQAPAKPQGDGGGGLTDAESAALDAMEAEKRKREEGAHKKREQDVADLDAMIEDMATQAGVTQKK